MSDFAVADALEAWHEELIQTDAKKSDTQTGANPIPIPAVVNRPLLQIQRFEGPVEIRGQKT